MKRKIAILLAATMTLGAVPTLAVNTKAPVAENTTTVSAGQMIFEPTSEEKTKYGPINVVLNNGDITQKVSEYKQYLATREGSIKIELESGNQFDGDIKAGTTFNLKLEGGKFTKIGKDLPEVAYRNADVFLNETNGKPFIDQFYVGKNTDGTTKLLSVNGSGQNPKVVEATSLKQVLDVFNKTLKVKTTTTDNTTTAEQRINAGEAVAPLPTIPYSIDITDETTATVTILHDISYNDIKNGLNVPESYEIKTDKTEVQPVRNQHVYFSIPLGALVESTGAEEVKVNVDGYGSKFIKDGTVTLAKSAGNGSTAIDTKYIDKKVFEYDFVPSDIIIRENIRGTFNKDQITVRLNNGFEFAGTAKDVKVTKANDSNSVLLNGDAVISSDKNKITFSLNAINSSEKEAIRITLPKIVPTDEAKNYGEVSVNIYGGGITDETVVLGERQQLGFKLETKTEVPTIVKGRYAKLNDTLKQKGNESAEFEFSELVPESLLTARNLDFIVPEGVKIVDAEVISMSGLAYTTSKDATFSIKDEGKTLRVERNTLNDTDKKGTAKMRLKLWLSVDAGYQGEEVKLTVTGGGSNENYEAVIAKVQAPFTVEAKTKDINIGYQDYAVNDIVIKENAPGMFMEGEEIALQITAPYGTSEMGFTKAKVTSEGEIEISPINGKTGDQYGYLEDNKTKDANNAIRIKVKTRSTKEPATITISDVKIGTTRSVPFGAYNLTIDGKALINNDIINDNDEFINGYSKSDKVISGLSYKLDNITGSNDKDNIEKAKRIDTTTSSFVVPGYVNVITANNTIDSEVKVAIGSTNATINGKEVAMDVAPYIQGTGNTMVPLRFVAVALAGGDATSVEAAQNSEKVSWDARTKTVTIFYGAGIGQKIIQFKIGSTNMIVDGNVIPMENGAKAEIKNGRTFVPFRALGQALGVSVSWDEATKTAIYNKQ